MCGVIMRLIKDIYTFISNLGFIDIVFFAAIITLLILLVSLVYFIKINKDDVLGEDDFFKGEEKLEETNNDKEKIIEKIEPKIEKEAYNDEEGELLDLKTITEKMAEEKEKPISITAYEKDQEEKAIISYDELLQVKDKIYNTLSNKS